MLQQYLQESHKAGHFTGTRNITIHAGQLPASCPEKRVAFPDPRHGIYLPQNRADTSKGEHPQSIASISCDEDLAFIGAWTNA